MKIFIVFAFLLLFCFTAMAQSGLPAFTAEANAFLKKYVKDGKVAYAAIKKDSKNISSLSAQIGSMPLAEATENTKKAF